MQGDPAEAEHGPEERGSDEPGGRPPARPPLPLAAREPADEHQAEHDGHDRPAPG